MHSVLAITFDILVVVWCYLTYTSPVVATVLLVVGAIPAARTRELLFIEVPLLIFQAAVGLDSILLKFSLPVATLSVACGLADRWLAQETKVGYWLGVSFFATMIVARLATFVTAFRVFGWWASIAVGFVLGLRASPFYASPSEVPIAFALALAPLGSRESYKFWTPADYDSATILEVLDSPVGVVNFGFHVLENLVVLLSMLLAGMTPSFLLVYGLLPTAIGTLCYAGTRSLNIKEKPIPRPPKRSSKPTMEETETVVL